MSSFNCENNDVKQLTVYLMLGRPLKWVDPLLSVESPSITRLICDGKLEMVLSEKRNVVLTRSTPVKE